MSRLTSSALFMCYTLIYNYKKESGVFSIPGSFLIVLKDSFLHNWNLRLDLQFRLNFLFGLFIIDFNNVSAIGS